LKQEEVQRLRRGEDDLSLEERYAHFTNHLAGLNEFDRGQHHIKYDQLHEQYTSSTTRFARDITRTTMSNAERTKILSNAAAFHSAVRGEVDYSLVPMPVDAWLARGKLQSATAITMATKKSFTLAVSCRHLPRGESEVDPVVFLVRPPAGVEHASAEEQEAAKATWILGLDKDQHASHREESTERQVNTCNPRFLRTFSWEVKTSSRVSDMQQVFERQVCE